MYIAVGSSKVWKSAYEVESASIHYPRIAMFFSVNSSVLFDRIV